MAKYSSSINYKITTTLDASGVNKLQAELSRVESQLRMMQTKGISLNNAQALKDIKQIQAALTSAFNPSLGMMNTKKLMAGLTANGRSLNDVFNSLGSRSTSAMTQLSGQISKIDTGMKSVDKTTDKVLNTLGNTVRWGVIASGFQYVLNSAHSAVQYMADLDESLTNIRMVTDESKESMRQFAKYANDAAKSLGNTTVAYTDAALIYAQQGYGLSDQKVLADYTLKVANATGQETGEVSEQMTSMINGYRLSVEEVGSALDVMAKVANTSAANLEELATASAKVASTANTLGVSQEQLVAQIATIVSVTREAPENVGNALKTIYARFGDLKLGETLEDGMDLGKVSSTLEKIGVQVLDSSGAMRDMGLIMEDLMAIWDTLDTATKQGAAVTLAGKYQYNRLMALMENSDMYEGYYNDAQTSEGTLDTMQAEYMDSLEGKANALKASFEGLLTSMFNQDDFGVVIEGLTEVVDKFTALTEAVDGGGQMLLAFGAIATKVFSGSIGRSLGNFIQNRQMQTLANQNVMQAAQVARNQFAGKGINVNDSRVQSFANDSARINQYAPNMNDEQIARSNDLLRQRETALTALIEKEKAHKQELTVLQAAFQAAGVGQEALEKGTLEFLRELESADVKLTDYKATLLATKDNIVNLRMGLSNLVQAMNSASQTNMDDEWNRVHQVATKLGKDLGVLKASLESMGVSSQKANRALTVFSKVASGDISNAQQLTKALSGLDLTLDQIVEALTKGSAGLNKQAADFDKAEAELRNLKISYDATRDAVQRFEAQLKTQTLATHLTNIASGAMNAVFAFQSLKNIGSIINNEDLTSAEKLEQIILNLSMVIAMGVPVITGALQGMKALHTQLQGYIVTQKAKILLDKQEITASTLKGEARHAAILADIEAAAVNKKITASQLARIAATYGLSEAEALAIVETQGLTVASMGLNTVLTHLLPKIAPFLAIGTAVTMVAAGVYSLYRAYTADARAAEEAAESSQQLKQVYSDLNTEVTNLKTNLEDYRSSKNALSELTKGTQEWRDAAAETNEQVLALLDSYPELAKYISRTKDGVLSISEQGMEAFVEEKERAALAAQNASLFGEITSDRAALNAQRTETARNVSYVDGFGNFVTLNPNTIDVLQQAYGEKTDLFDPDVLSSLLGLDVADPMVQAIMNSSADLIRYFEAANTEELTSQINQEQIMQNLLDQQEGYEAASQANNDALLAALVDMGGIDSEVYQNALKEQERKSTEQLAREYAEQQGLDTSGMEIDHNFLGKGDDVVTIDGKPVSRQAMEESLASADAMQEAAAMWNDVADKLLGINSTDFDKKVGGQAYDSMQGFATTGSVDVSGWTEGEKQRAQELLNSKQNSPLTKEDLFGAGKSEEYYQQAVDNLGYDGSPEDYAKAYSEALAQSLGTDTANSLKTYVDEQVNAGQTGSRAGDNIISDKAKTSEELEYAKDKGQLTAVGSAESFIKLGKAVGGVEDEVTNAEKALQEYNDTLNDSSALAGEKKRAAEKLASAEEELRDAIKTQEWETARENLQEYSETLQSAEKGSEEYAAAAQKIGDSLSELTGQDVTAQWIEENHQAVTDWLNGVEGAGAKLGALINLDNPVNSAKAAMADLNVSWDAMRAQIENNDIQFDMNGHADFSQVETALSALSGHTFDTTQDLDLLAAYLNALGGASLKLTHEDGTVESVAAPDMTGSPEEVTASVNRWIQDLQAKLRQGWSFSGIDLPDSQRKIPTSNKSGSGKTGGSGGGSGGGGGGGGGGGSSYEPKTEEYFEEEPDRYQDVNAHLDRLSNNLDKIADEQDRLTGKALLDNMQKQVDLIQEQTDWHQKKLEIQQQEAAELRKELGADYGLTFDANGYIENYETIHQQLIDEYNALVDEYNAATTEEAQEAIKERMDELKEKIDRFNEGWERYDELMNNEIPESIKTLEDLEDQIEDIRIEAFNAAVEAADNIKEVQDAWAEYMGFMSGLHPDSPFRALTEDAMKYENALDSVAAKQEDLDNLMKWLPQYQPGGVITSDNPFGENSAEFYEALQTAYQSYIEAALEAEQLYYDQINDIIEGYDDIADRIEKRMENYARLTEQLDHYASVIETLYGEEDYDNLLAIKRANQDALESSIEQQRANLTMWQNELAKYNKETQPEIWEAIHEQVVEAEEELNGLVEEAAENTAAILEMAVDKTVKEWKDTMLGGDADWMETQWELIKQNADQYLDTVEETYELEKLRSKYNSLANDTADLNLRKRINDQMEKELAYLKEKDKLSEYDVNYANAKLEILQKQIALEEAQANKNQMKLRRDSQGNYSYVYTANQDDVENARNDLLDSEFNAYSMSKENYLTNYDNYIAAISAAAEQIKAINADTMLSEEEKAERTQWIYDNLKQYLSGIAEQIGVSEQGMLESVKYLAMDSSEIVGQNYADIAAMMEENWTEALGVIGVAVSEEFDHIIHNMDEFLDKTQEKWTEFEDHTQEWADNVNDIADEGTNGFRDIDDVIIDINSDMKELNEETESFFALINDDLGTIDNAVGKLADYEKQILGLKESSSKIRAELDLARAEIVKKDNEIRDWEIKFQKATEPAPSGGDGSGGSGGSGSGDGYAGTKYTKEQLIEGLAGNIWVYADWKNDPTRADSLTKKFNATVAKEVQSYVNKGMSALKHEYTYYKNFAPSKFDTGGYTGVWGKEGRLAMLHQKELVLNASDTSNILAAVSAIREIVSVMKADSIGSMLSVGRNSNIATNTGSNIQQNVEIYADFPAAESAAEIKAALEGLAQQAVQYSMRTR